MGLFSNIRNILTNPKNTQDIQVDDEYEKQRLAEKIIDLARKIQRINSFDSSIWNLTNASSYDLQRKSLPELQHLYSNLERKLSELNKKSQKENKSKETFESAKWTGNQPKNMNNIEFDNFQRRDDYR